MLIHVCGQLGYICPLPPRASVIQRPPGITSHTTGTLSEALSIPHDHEASLSTGKHWAFGKRSTQWCQSHSFIQQTEELFHAGQSIKFPCLIMPCFRELQILNKWSQDRCWGIAEKTALHSDQWGSRWFCDQSRTKGSWKG